jgi:hypothetical protein
MRLNFSAWNCRVERVAPQGSGRQRGYALPAFEPPPSFDNKVQTRMQANR